VVLVTSPGLGEGKTTVSVNSAEAFAQLGRPVVIVDADIRRARIHEVFGCPRAPGLVDVLHGKATLKDAVKPTALPNLHVLAAGTETANPAEILASEGVREAIDELKATYGLVWIDSPPVMLVADSRVLVPLSDMVLIVVRATRTRRREFQRAYELISSATAGAQDGSSTGTALVAVVNAVPHSVSKQYGYYRSSYGGYYRPPPLAPATPTNGAASESADARTRVETGAHGS
jgi:capsular exopolysaccharide synthesis family protein